MNNIPITIPSGSSLSYPVDLRGRKIAGMIMPEAWTPATITFTSSVDGQSWRNMFNMAGTEISATVSASQHIVADSPFPSSWDGSNGAPPDSWWLRLRSGTSAAPIIQTQDATILLVLK